MGVSRRFSYLFGYMKIVNIPDGIKFIHYPKVAYLHEKPRRLAIRREHPDYFRVQFGVTVAGQTYAAIGNRFLLDSPDMEQVQLTRSLTEAQIAKERDKFLAMAKTETVLVSPAISTGERIPLTRAMCLALNKMAEDIVKRSR